MTSSKRRFVEVFDNDFACSVCYEEIYSAVFQCREGHILCEACLYMLTKPRKCPTCRCPFPPVVARCRPIEAVVARLELDCKYGCGFKSTSTSVAKHLASCALRAFACELCQPSGQDTKVNLSLLSEHYYHHHATHFTRGYGVSFKGFSLADWDALRSYPLRVHQLEDQFLIIKINLFLPLRCSQEIDTNAMQIVVWHSEKSVPVQVSLRQDEEDEELIAMGPIGTSKKIPDGEKIELHQGDVDGCHVFHRQLLRSNLVESQNFAINLCFV